MSPAIPLPRVIIPGVPLAHVCLMQIAKAFEGNREVKFETSYPCDQKTSRDHLTATVKLYDGKPCDESVKIVPEGSQLNAEGSIVYRADGLAHFSGRFTIQSPGGVLLFSGYMEAIDRICTHVPLPPQGACRPKGHVEGWLVGKGGRGLEDYTLRALIAARVKLLPEFLRSPFVGFLNGVLVKSPKE